jgi:hypothetical protein
MGLGMMEWIEPLDSALWFRQIEKIANGALAGMEQSLRHASHLLQLTPLRFRDVVRLAINEDEFEELLDAGDFDTAARHLIAQPAALEVGDHEDGRNIQATISCLILNRAIHGSGPTIADAVLSAWTTCLLALETDERSVRLTG